MAESGANSPEIVRSEFLDAGFSRVLLDTVPDDFSLNPLPNTVPARVTRLKILPFKIPADCSQSSMRFFTQSGTGMVRM